MGRIIFRYVNEAGGEIILDRFSGFLIGKPVGIDTVAISYQEAQGINQVGTTIKSNSVQHREVVIEGILIGPEQQMNKTRLLEVVRPDIPGKLYAGDYYLDVFPTETPTVEGRLAHAAFEFSLMAPYPYWQHEEIADVTLSGVDPLFRLSSGVDGDGNAIPAWNISGQYAFGRKRSEQFVVIKNSGQLPVPFTVVISSTTGAENPSIENAVTGERIAIVKTMAAGERITVEITHDRTYLTSNVDGDIRGALTLDSDLIRLAPGDNVLKPTTESGEIDVSIRYAIEKVGVVI